MQNATTQKKPIPQIQPQVDWKQSIAPIDYEDALAFMEARVGDIAAGRAGDLVWLLEHPPLYTGGTSARLEDLLNPGFPVYETGRGGEYTYHGPGQRVAYLMLDLKKRQQEPDLKRYIWQLEEWIIRTLARFGLAGERREGRIGIWVKTGDTEAKIAAIGVRIRHWVAYHGIAINNTTDLAHFDGIVPCGIRGFGVTSLKEMGVDVSMDDLDRALKDSFAEVFDIK